MRQILQVEINRVGLVGTYHPPVSEAAAPAVAPGCPLPGVLLINFGQFNRAGPADLPVHLAERLCQRGYPVFRFDMPGLGDTPGDLPEHFETYWRFVQAGGHALWLRDLVMALKQRFTLSGFVLGGLCGSANSAIFAAELLQGDVLGLVLLDPAVSVTDAPVGAESPSAVSAQWSWAGIRARMHGTYRSTRTRVRASKWSSPLRWVRDSIQRLVRRLRGRRFPHGVNLPLVHCWQKLGNAGLPMIVLSDPSVPSAWHLVIRYDIFPPRNRNRVTLVDVDHTNHLFVTGAGRETTLAEIERWMTANFPP